MKTQSLPQSGINRHFTLDAYSSTAILFSHVNNAHVTSILPK